MVPMTLLRWSNLIGPRGVSVRLTALERRHQFFPVARIAAGRHEARIQHLAIAIEQRRILARNGVIIPQHAIDETLVGFGLQIERIGCGADQTDRLVAEALEQEVVCASLARHHLVLETGRGVLLHKPDRI